MRTFRQFITEAMTISTNGGGEGGGEGSSASLFVNPLPSLIPTDTPLSLIHISEPTRPY